MQKKELAKIFSNLISAIGEDVNRNGLRDTPERAAEAFRFLTSGYGKTAREIVNGALFECDNQDMVAVQNIELFSLCEHHLLPIVGKCHIAYMPKGKVLGLSKIARIVDIYARRLQIQEILTKQIGEAIMEITNASGVGVVIEAEHLCIMARGVEKQHAQVKTSSMLGSFSSNPELRSDFLKLINDCPNE